MNSHTQILNGKAGSIIIDFLLELSTAASIPQFFSRITQGLGRLIPYDNSFQWFRLKNEDAKGFYPAFSDNKPSFTCIYHSASDAGFIDAFNGYYRNLQPKPERFEKDVYIVDWKVWNDTQYYFDLVRPRGIRYSMVPVNRKLNFNLTIQRGKGIPFKAEEAEAISLLSPYLDNIFNILSGTEEKRNLLLCSETFAFSKLPLTKSEKQILRLVCTGLSAGGIAVNIGISQRTVEKHIQNIYEKLSINNREDLYFKCFPDPKSGT